MASVADTIWAQMGGSKAGAMIGVKHLVGSGNALNVRYAARAKNGANHVKIELDPSDTYTVTFYKIGKGGLNVQEIKSVSMVYADSLRSLFTAETGLYLSL
jgi:predicted RNA-binding protein YlqC (UPF0109 family)